MNLMPWESLFTQNVMILSIHLIPLYHIILLSPDKSAFSELLPAAVTKVDHNVVRKFKWDIYENTL